MSKRQFVISFVFAVLVIGFLALLTIYSTSLKDRTGSAGVNSKFSGYKMDSEPAYNFQASTHLGETISLSDYKGSIVLLDFWSSWCAPCKKEAVALNELYVEYLGNNYDEVDKQTVVVDVAYDGADMDGDEVYDDTGNAAAVDGTLTFTYNINDDEPARNTFLISNQTSTMEPHQVTKLHLY